MCVVRVLDVGVHGEGPRFRRAEVGVLGLGVRGEGPMFRHAW